jgi:hypothetical protein
MFATHQQAATHHSPLSDDAKIERKTEDSKFSRKKIQKS